jgi:hypothetical protein
MLFRSFTVALVLIAGSFVVSYIRDGYSFGSVVPPARELSSTKLNLAGWKGTELPEDPRIREVLRARSGIDRVYQNKNGESVLVHAVWTDDYLRLHFPQQCYRESGWNDDGVSDVLVSTTGDTQFPAKILGFNQDGRRIKVLYWFQLGDHVFLDRVQHRWLRRKVCWGKKEWPPLMKFMLETPDRGDADERLLKLAGQLHDDIHSVTN